MKELIAALALVFAVGVGSAEPLKADSANFVVHPNSTDTIDLTVTGGEVLLTVQGDESSNLDFYVYDMEGNLVFVDEDETDLLFAIFDVPDDGGLYQLLVVNQGDTSNIYRVDLI